jgi:drug/metabolite transporter (DMT)-like permease
MTTDRSRAVAALTVAGLAWGATVPLSKLALGWLAPGWLTVARFGVAAAILLLAMPRVKVRAACTPGILASGAAGYGASVVLQNAGLARTSVTHAALLVGATPVLVAVIAAAWHRTVARPVAWVGFAVSLAGVALISASRAGGATTAGDGLVLASLLSSSAFTVAQTRLLRGRDPIALSAAQFLGAALAALPLAAVTEGMPAVPHHPGAVMATVALAVGGTMLPFTMFAYGQSRVSAEVAGAFVNFEPLVGAAVGIAAFGDPLGPAQLAGGAAIITGIAMSTLPVLAPWRRRLAQVATRREGGREKLTAMAHAVGHTSRPVSRSALVGGLVLPHNLGGNPSAFGDRQARVAGPRPNGGAVHPLSGRPAAAPSPAATEGPSAGGDERRERGGQPSPVRLGEVDLVAHPVDPECDGLGVRRAVDIVCYYHGNTSGHDTDPAKRQRPAQHDIPRKGCHVIRLSAWAPNGQVAQKQRRDAPKQRRAAR